MKYKLLQTIGISKDEIVLLKQENGKLNGVHMKHEHALRQVKGNLIGLIYSIGPETNPQIVSSSFASSQEDHTL